MGLHPELGVWLPQLERLKVQYSLGTAVPEGLTRLTGLDLINGWAEQLTLPPDLSGLKELAVPRSRYTSLAGLGHLPGLELLDVSYTGALGSSLDVLRSLPTLRHLNLKNITGCDPASFTALGALQQLTYLNMDGLLNCTAAVASLVPLPSVRELHMGRFGIPWLLQEHHQPELHAFGPWLQQMTGVTKLVVTGHIVTQEDELQYLPGQLQWLKLNKMGGLRCVPSGLQQLYALRVLDIRGNKLLSRLPQWLWVLPRLEEINLRGTAVKSTQEVLAFMPHLRYVLTQHAARLLKPAQHLHFGPGTSTGDAD
jgi:Leucine-rich repeat (LRR) protein